MNNMGDPTFNLQLI